MSPHRRFVAALGTAALLTVLPASTAWASTSPTPTATPSSSSTSSPAVTPTEASTTWPGIAIAVIALFAACLVAYWIITMVREAHGYQLSLAQAAAAEGQPITYQPDDAAGLQAAGADLSISGPSVIRKGAASTYTVSTDTTAPWVITGLTDFAQSLPDAKTLVLTAGSTGTATISATIDGSIVTPKSVTVLDSEASNAFQVRFAVSHWGLVLVASILAFGGIAAVATGHLDAGNFVALATALAALLGVTVASSGSGSGAGGGSGSTSGGSAATGGTTPAAGGSGGTSS